MERAGGRVAAKLPKSKAGLALCTANLTAAGPIATVLDHVQGRVWFLQEHHLLKAECDTKQASWIKDGHKLALAPAISGRVAGNARSSSGGVGFAWGPGTVLVDELRVLAPGRLATVRLLLPALGEVQCASIYGDVASEHRASELIRVALEELASTGKPGILGGDFNLPVAAVRDTIASVGLERQWKIVAPESPTCCLGDHRSIIDFFVCHVSLAPFLGQALVEQHWAWAPHKPVVLRLRVDRQALESKVLVWRRPPKPAGKPLLGPQLLPPVPAAELSGRMDEWFSGAVAF